MDLLISSYPRAGSTYLAYELSNYISSKNIKKTHEIDLDLRATTNVYLLRNPVESISSAVSMLKHFGKKSDIDHEIKTYNKSIEYHIKNIDMFIPFKYSQVIADSYLCSKYILSLGYNLEISKKSISLPVKDDNSEKFLRTSKSYSGYDYEWINVFNNKNIESSVLFYQKMIECIDKRQKELNIKID
jgi:hypothetical protein